MIADAMVGISTLVHSFSKLEAPISSDLPARGAFADGVHGSYNYRVCLHVASQMA